jgi:hypothetical protein
VSGVEQVENPVGKSDAIIPARSPSLRFRPGRNFFCRTPGRQRLLATDGWKCSTFSFLNGSLMTAS